MRRNCCSARVGFDWDLAMKWNKWEIGDGMGHGTAEGVIAPVLADARGVLQRVSPQLWPHPALTAAIDLY